MQLRELTELRGEKLKPSDLATPQVVQLLLAQQMRSLADLKAARAETVDLREGLQQITNDHTQLKVKLAKSTERQKVLVLEIPIGFLSGFAINMLTTSKFVDPVGWVLLILSIVMLLMLFASQRIRMLFDKKESGNGVKED
jgi:hypothetical protein